MVVTAPCPPGAVPARDGGRERRGRARGQHGPRAHRARGQRHGHHALEPDAGHAPQARLHVAPAPQELGRIPTPGTAGPEQGLGGSPRGPKHPGHGRSGSGGTSRVAPAFAGPDPPGRSPNGPKPAGTSPNRGSRAFRVLPAASEPAESSDVDSKRGRGGDSSGRWFLGGNREGGGRSQPGVGGDPEGIFCRDFGALCQGWNVSSEDGRREQLQQKINCYIRLLLPSVPPHSRSLPTSAAAQSGLHLVSNLLGLGPDPRWESSPKGPVGSGAAFPTPATFPTQTHPRGAQDSTANSCSLTQLSHLGTVFSSP